MSSDLLGQSQDCQQQAFHWRALDGATRPREILSEAIAICTFIFQRCAQETLAIVFVRRDVLLARLLH